MNDTIQGSNHTGADAGAALRSERDSAHRNIDQAAQQVAAKADRAIDKAAPMVDRAVSKGGEMAHAAVDRMADSAERSANWVRANSEKVRTNVDSARHRTAERVRDDPIKSVLIAAAAGALVYAVLHALRGDDR